jgi:hypothetical protein
MKTPAPGTLIVLLSGIVGLGVGAALLAAPVAFYAADGVTIGDQRGLLSDLRGTGASLFALGGFILAGAFRPSFTRVASGVSALVYLSYAGGRGVAILLDGTPSPAVLTVLAVEFGLGASCLFVMVHPPVRPGEGS